MPETLRRRGRDAGWGVLAVILGGAAVAIWLSTPQSESQTALALMLSVLAAAAVYLCFAEPLGLWSIRRRRGIDLVFEIVGNWLRLSFVNLGPPAEFSAQVTSLCQPPTGRPKGPQHWLIPWLDDHTVEPKRILSGQTRTLDFAIFDPAAVNESLRTCHDGTEHWRFASLPEPIRVKYYNLLSLSDVNDQEFILTVRIMNADSENYLDWQIAVKVMDSNVVCELAPIKRRRFTRAPGKVGTTSWSAGTQLSLGRSLVAGCAFELFGR